MDEFLKSFIYKKVKIGKAYFTILDIIFLLGISISGFMMRMSLKSVVTVDYSYFLKQWVGELKASGFSALKGDFYNYNPPYMVILYFISILKINPLTGIKLVSCFFDAITTITVAAIVMDITKSKLRTMFAYGAAWILPTVVTNGAMWAQCDSIYTCFIILAVYCIIKGKSLKSMIFYGIAFGFKMQTLFILPGFIILWSKRKVKLVHFLCIPIIYFISLLPAVFAGKSFGDTIGLYMGQAEEQGYLAYNWPGLYEIFGVDSNYINFGSAAMWFVLGILMCIMFYFAYKNYEISNAHIIDIFLFIAMVAVYFLPHMHERYGYVAGILAIIVGLVNTQKLYIPIIHVIASYGAYQAWLADHRVVPFWVYSFALLFLILDLGIYIYKYINVNSTSYKMGKKDLIHLLHKEYKICEMKLSFLHILLFVGVTIATLAMRYSFKDYEARDYIASWEPWIATMKEMGGLKGLSGDFYNCTPMYAFIILLLSYLPIKLLYIIKSFLVVFDIIMAIMSGVIIYDITKNRTKAIGIYSIMMLLPTVASNSAMCSQSEVLYTTAILCAIYYIMKDRPAQGMFFYGIAFVLNFQSLFVFPAIIVLWALKKINLKHFLFIPFMYFVGILPAWIAGRPLKELVMSYVVQAEKLPQLSLGYPNIYQILGTKDFVDVYASAGIWLTIGFLLVVMFYIVRSRIEVSKEFVVQLFLIFVLISVCFLPFVQESYAYVADVIAVILAFIYLEKFYIPLLQIFVSYSAYSIVASEYINVPIVIYSFVALYLVFDVGMGIYQYINTILNESENVEKY